MNSENKLQNQEEKVNDKEIEKMLENVDFLNKRCEVLESDLFKSQTKIKKQDFEIKKLQEINTINNKVIIFFIKEQQQYFNSLLLAIRI